MKKGQTFCENSLHRMLTHKTPKNETCTYGYDLRDRQTLADWNSTTPDTSKTYWSNGLLKSIDNGVSKSDYAYSLRNELTSETQTLGGQAPRVVTYGYDADGLRGGMVHPSSRIVDLTWTAKGQLQAVTADGPPPFATYGYDKAGRITGIAHENGVTEVKTYNAASELLGNVHQFGGTMVGSHAYGYDLTGRRTSEQGGTALTPVDKTFGYDTADQVTSATYGNNLLADAYNYDAMGNRTTATVASLGGASTTYTANNANQYTSISGMSAPSHDANGNLVQQNNVTYDWDSENRLLAVTPNTPALGDRSLVHNYDGQHRRVTRTIREWTTTGWAEVETIHFIYDGWNVIEEYALAGGGPVLRRTFTWGADLSGSLQGAGGVGGLLMTEEISGTTTTAYHFHYDGNGNITEITDNTGSSAASYRYDAFGNTLVAIGSYATQNRYRFSTKSLDHEVLNAPLYYYGYRYYDPVTGRWPSRDPIEEQGGINLYGFVGNDGVNAWDFLGLHCRDCNQELTDTLELIQLTEEGAIMSAETNRDNAIAAATAAKASMMAGPCVAAGRRFGPLAQAACEQQASAIKLLAETRIRTVHTATIAVIQLIRAAAEDGAYADYRHCVGGWGTDDDGCPCAGTHPYAP